MINDILFSEVIKTQSKSLEKSIENAVASIEMEGYHIDDQSKALCRQLLSGEISMEEYIRLIKQKVGVN
ncbi:MAG: hypothetical protein UHD05_10100 [Ruminococcus sp.]|nr:hypothetical protein [Ruminococcus sp.]